MNNTGLMFENAQAFNALILFAEVGDAASTAACTCLAPPYVASSSCMAAHTTLQRFVTVILLWLL
jgi:hypothetical protein